MKQNSTTKGKLACIGMRANRKSKSRQTNSSFGYFDLGNKAIVPYNLKHLLRSLENVTIQEQIASSSTPKMGTLANKVNSRRKLAVVGLKTDYLTFVASPPQQLGAFSLELP